MFTIKGKEYNPRIDNNTLFDYASFKGIGIAKLFSLLEDITPDHLKGVIVFAATKENLGINMDDINEEINQRIEFISELMLHLAENLTPKVPESEETKKKGSKANP
jgi:hypothetical protein